MNNNTEKCTHNCNTCGISCPSRAGTGDKKTNEFSESQNSMSNIKRVIGVLSGKGGVGKSFVTSLLAVSESRKGKNVAILDADITGPSIPKIFGVNGEVTGIDQGMFPLKSDGGISIMSANLLLESETSPVIWRGPVISGMVKQFWSGVVWGEIDTMYIDMPPGTGDVPLTIFQSLPINGIVIVTTPQHLVSIIVEKSINMAAKMNIPVLGIVENLSYVQCPDCNKKIYIYGQGYAEQISKKYNIPILARLPINTDAATLCDSGKIEQITNSSFDIKI